jgi:transposase-like protein
MPWRECDRMSIRTEFVLLAASEDVSMAELCRRYEVSRKTGYKWLERYHQAGRTGLSDRSRAPLISPGRTNEERERLVVEVRRAHPAWGGRKIKRWLQDQGHQDVPVPSTITEILHRHGLIDAEASRQAQPLTRRVPLLSLLSSALQVWEGRPVERSGSAGASPSQESCPTLTRSPPLGPGLM